ncbi:MAG: DNA methyltransferase, partial [Candidatus Cloacimonetes bacterium]|nr:DNA methyltransferase [Candidatus Cloacimonadota bacterium]
KQASDWATQRLGRKVSTSNISYLLQYGRIRKYADNGQSVVSKEELSAYYDSIKGDKKHEWTRQLGDDLNWELSFDKYTESETTKHVHRFHPYKGKFIPQLVEYFLDTHLDKYKREVFFQPGDIVLDPFSGSGTTLVQANELALHAVGIDVSAFNVQIASSKIMNYDLDSLNHEITKLTKSLNNFLMGSKVFDFERELLYELKSFNQEYFPVPDFKYKLRHNLIDEKSYTLDKENKFLPTYHALVEKYSIKLLQDKSDTFLDKWFTLQIREELEFMFQEIRRIPDIKIRKLASIILSRTMRSCRATTHSDLATLIDPVTATYYCTKHGKICKPLFSILKWWESYSRDTINRVKILSKLRTDTQQVCITGDSRKVDIYEKVRAVNSDFAEKIKQQKIKGIFSSPPYVGLIDYHEQHAYAYDLFGFERHDELEIGPLYRGQGIQARESYSEGISQVLLNCKRFLADDYNVFLVANDKYNMYPNIAEKAGMRIVNQYKRPVLNRTEKDKAAYSEIIFHLKDNGEKP